ncbi:MAG TPA: HepT-like ribonuclease domain-containing protein [Desulfobacterales bacterium]|nr:HepT-like ribonuclease domain-containing protein [Desulfobacterales bacterium]
MPRDPRAYLADIIASSDAIKTAIAGLDVTGYQASRLVRSAVEREFIIIGEAVAALAHRAPDWFAAITNARRIIDFRNQLTHEYPTISDVVVFAIAAKDAPVLQRECTRLLEQSRGKPE